jgi:hypothetical protein
MVQMGREMDLKALMAPMVQTGRGKGLATAPEMDPETVLDWFHGR